ncbi:hypothetical protein B0T22DRAFT_299872 [Podospora appendiculata]|uniref:Carbohydrate-binding module family 50 protein n=1 Tax=Podospora appendiculata TaxID=314037 RepID=A0AAE1C7L9_9PEZI|nr:hypothetical protein B0T22DRAFT_299872 [Podospora appendiculata]
MGRWAHLDTDEERLPDGMTRVGYDADTQIYTYRDTDGSYWEGAPGSQYGRMHRVKGPDAPRLPNVHIPDDIEGDEQLYVLHDADVDTDYDDEGFGSETALTAPKKARLSESHQPSRLHQQAGKALPSLPDKTADSSTTTGSDEKTLIETEETAQHALGRSNTVVRIARFLSRGSGSTASTLSGDGATTKTGAGKGKMGWPRRASTVRETTTSLPRRQGAGGRKRATTFEEILGER